VKRLLLFFALLLVPSAAFADCVVFLHGYARAPTSFSIMSRVFLRKGYETVKVGYASKKGEIPALAETTVPEAVEQCSDGSKVHFVTHSLGGILLREYLATHKIEHLGRSVMLGPPNQGAQIVDKLEKLKAFKKLSGPALQALRTGLVVI